MRAELSEIFTIDVVLPGLQNGRWSLHLNFPGAFRTSEGTRHWKMLLKGHMRGVSDHAKQAEVPQGGVQHGPVLIYITFHTK